MADTVRKFEIVTSELRACLLQWGAQFLGLSLDLPEVCSTQGCSKTICDFCDTSDTLFASLSLEQVSCIRGEVKTLGDFDPQALGRKTGQLNFLCLETLIRHLKQH